MKQSFSPPHPTPHIFFFGGGDWAVVEAQCNNGSDRGIEEPSSNFSSVHYIQLRAFILRKGMNPFLLPNPNYG